MTRPKVHFVAPPGTLGEGLVQALLASTSFDFRVQSLTPGGDVLAQMMAEPPDLVILAGNHESTLTLVNRLDFVGMRPAIMACVEGGRPEPPNYESGPKLSFLDPGRSTAAVEEQIVEALDDAADNPDSSLTVADYLELCRGLQLTVRLEASLHDRRGMLLEMVSGDLWTASVDDLDGELALASVVHQVPVQIALRELTQPPAQRQPDFQPADDNPDDGSNGADAAGDRGSAPARKTLRILVLEPEPASFKTILEQEGTTSRQGWHIQVVHESTLAAATTVLIAGDIDLLAVDLALTGEPELKTFGLLRGKAPRLPAVVIVNLDHIELGFKALERGAQECLIKEQLGDLPVASLLTLAKKRHDLAAIWSAETLEAQSGEANLQSVLSSIDEAVIVLGGSGGVTFNNRRAQEVVDLSDREVVAHLASLPATVSGHGGDGQPVELVVESADASWSGRPAKLLRLRPKSNDAEAHFAGLDELILTLANEQRGALAALSGFLDLLRKGKVEDPDIQQEFLASMHQQAERLSCLVDDLPDLVRMADQRLDLTLIDVSVAGVISETLLTVRGKAEEKELELRFESPESTLEVRGDRDRLCEALAKILDNAIKFSTEPGVVDVNCERVSGGDHPQVAIRVRDRGPGIPEEVIPHLCERFFQGSSEVKRNAGGAGLGLYKARQIVEAHGGQIVIDSVETEGTTVSILLPAVDDDVAGGPGSGSGSERARETLEIHEKLDLETPVEAQAAALRAPTDAAETGPGMEVPTPAALDSVAPAAEVRTVEDGLHIIWLGGASCDGCSMAVLGASNPGIEELLLGNVPDAPPVTLIHPALALESGAEYLAILNRASRGELGQYVMALEGSIFDESLAGEGYFSHIGDDDDGRPLTIADWVDRLTPAAAALVAVGSCATWGGIPAAQGSPTGAMGLGKYLGKDFTERTGVPIINLPGCAPSGEAVIETVVSAIFHLLGLSPLELDDDLRPSWLYNQRAHPMPPHASYLPASAYDTEGRPSVGCPVPSQGWMNRVGGCANVGGACIGCTAPDFADRYLSHARLSAGA